MEDGTESISKRSRMSIVDSVKEGPEVRRRQPTKSEKGKGKKGREEKVNDIKIGIIGMRGVGKSSILKRFITGEEIDINKKAPTIGYEEVKLHVEINGEPFCIKFYDMGGQKTFIDLTNNFIR